MLKATRDDINVSHAVAATWSLIGDGTGATITGANNQIGNAAAAIDPFLLPLADNGGPTMTHALQAFSPARNMGNPSAIPGSNGVPLFDQRGSGFARKVGSRIDIGAYESETAMVCVSTTIDEIDTDFSLGDFSLREAVNYANTASEATTICLPAGVYGLTLTGTGGASQGDLDITGNVAIVGDGPGVSIINASGFGVNNSDRIFDIASGKTLNLTGVTLTLGYAPSPSGQRNGGAIRVQNGGILNLDFSAIVNNSTGDFGDGGAIYFASTAAGSITNSVITFNFADDQTGGVYLAASAPGAGGTVTVTRSIIAKNTDCSGFGPDVYADTNRKFTSGGNNRLGNATTGFAHNVMGDYIGTPDDIVTSVADTYDGSADPVSMSIRDALAQADAQPGTQEIWLPAWKFVLTRQRTTAANLPEMNIPEGDLDINESVIIRGINGPLNIAATSVEWMTAAVADKVFELLGDYNGDRIVDNADYQIWFATQGTSNLADDGNDDGVVNGYDGNLCNSRLGNTLTLDSVLIA